MITYKNVSKAFFVKGKAINAVSNVDLTVRQNEIYGIIGFSGAGKSTLLRIANLLEKPTKGTVFIDNQELTALSSSQLREARHKIGMIFQHFNLLANRTVRGNVSLALELANVDKKERENIIDEVLQIVDLSEKADQYPSQLSGGQKQRVAIARAISTRPKVLLCDEPTSALDPQTTQSILAYLKKINKTYGVTILIVTHEMDVIRNLTDRVAVMEQGRIVEELSLQGHKDAIKTKIGRILLNRDHQEVVASG
ncbi:ATP-binding cassette domain-containing protein (plasmid) [Cytobacillus oceanisediminis]|uniref:methionine ABC transporter ATP-binding protein n=1 Tax=Cytobacillus oceanisediminis TaxID=665099 RepID=UPI001863F5E9|nr:ATP-binding cassette domain-containing protein [Cytobacillus oceanisediminis]QOK29881.1 ATP-binding cassette domain-containing protein [Cytobacillus oceanisediminis]